MTRIKLFWLTTACEGPFMPMLPEFHIDWSRLKPNG